MHTVMRNMYTVQVFLKFESIEYQLITVQYHSGILT